MGIASVPTFIAGERIDPEGSSAARIASLDGALSVPVSETTSAQLRHALRHAHVCQQTLQATPLAQRIADARRMMEQYSDRAEDVAFALGTFRGLVARDARWMCEVNVRLASQLEQLVHIACGDGMNRDVHDGAKPLGRLVWRSRGTGSLFSSSTMDGPAAVVALCHAMVSGTHLVFKPSFRDVATHLAFDVLYEHGLSHYAQLVRWSAESSTAAALNRTTLGNVAQFMVFSSNETFQQLLADTASPASPEWEALRARGRRYGTGLPLAVVTGAGDLDTAARDLIEGARLGGGRFCLSAGPVLVERGCQKALIAKIVAHATKLRRGNPLEMSTDLSWHSAEDAAGLRVAVQSFGGTHESGEIRDTDMDVLLLSDVPTTSPALHRELPGPVLSLVPFDDLDAACKLATTALGRNGRDAWTALVTWGSDADCAAVERDVASYRYLRGGVVASVKLLLPHQGAYFASDLMRRISLEWA